MRHKLYEIKTHRESVFNRNHAVDFYNKIARSRLAFAVVINSILVDCPKGRGFAPLRTASNLINYLRHWKQEYKRMHNIPTEMTVRRNYHGQLIEVQIEPRNRKRHPVTGEPVNDGLTSADKLYALKQVMERVKQMRRREKHIEWTSEILCRIANREPNGLLKEFNKKRLSLPKRPKDGADYVGIEIECILPDGVDLAPLFPFAKYIEVGGDGSIEHKSGEIGREVKVCIVRDEVRKVLPDLMQALKDMGARVNKSCGLHIHLDQRNNKEPEKAFQKLVRSLGLLYTVVPESRRRNRYCKRNRHSDFQQAVRGDRYKAINASAFHKYNTIEIRLFGGSLEAIKIINWIEVLLAIAYGEMVMRCPKSFDTAVKYWKLSEENVAWLKERQTKFSTINAGMPVSEHETEPNQALLDETQEDEDETCGECENSMDDCSCNQECDCGECETCEENQRESDRIARRNREARECAAQPTPPPTSNIVMSVDPAVNGWWVGEVPAAPEPLTITAMQRAVNEIQNQQIESMNQHMYHNIVFSNNDVWGVDAAAQPAENPPTQPPPATPESNDEVQF